MNTLDKIRALDPVTDEVLQAATRNREGMWNGLIARTAQEQVPTKLRPRRTVARRVVPVLVAASLIGGIAVTAYERSDGSRTEALGPALAFADNGSKLTITIVDLQADADRFNRELAEHQLKFTLTLQPASPSAVGQVTAGFGDGNESSAPAVSQIPRGCEVGGASPCNITISIAKGYQGEGGLEIGRPPQPGEEILYNGDLADRGEPLAGLKYKGLPVSRVRELLRQRGFTVGEYVVSLGDRSEGRATVPDHWIVQDGMLIKDHETRLMVREP
jgi:hypothetical protein